MTQPLPAYESQTLAGRRVLKDLIGAEIGESVIGQNDNADSGSTPTHRLRPGNVLVLRTSTGEYVEANDSNGDRSEPPSVSSAEAADTDWDGTTITTYLNGTLVSTVVLAGTDDTTAEVVTALNTDYAAKNLPIIATGTNGNPVVVKAHAGGAGVSLRLESTLATAFATAGGAGSYAEDVGADADYLVSRDFADHKDGDGVAQSPVIPTYRKGHFIEADLINLTADAKAVLSRRGSTFS